MEILFVSCLFLTLARHDRLMGSSTGLSVNRMHRIWGGYRRE
jgi:hypothetical protein